MSMIRKLFVELYIISALIIIYVIAVDMTMLEHMISLGLAKPFLLYTHFFLLIISFYEAYRIGLREGEKKAGDKRG